MIHIPNEIFKVVNYHKSRICRLRYPAYYTVIKQIKPGEELLVVVNYDGEQINPNKDIAR